MERRSDKFKNVIKSSVPVSRRVVSQPNAQAPSAKVVQKPAIARNANQQPQQAQAPANKKSGCGCSRKKSP